MLTSRGWWFLIIVGLQVLLGVVALPVWTVTPAVIGLALLVWFGGEWAAFHWRLNAAVSRLVVERRIVQGERDVPMVWAGVHFTVRVEVGYEAGAAVPFILIEDRLPVGVELQTGDASTSTLMEPGRPVVLSYDLRCPVLGVIRFEGVRVRVADLHGFFYHRVSLREGAEYLVLPRLSDDEGRQRADKRFNTLPPPGVHRLRRPGSGSELLDLRDYRPGDPPKMIAWKASARRDRLITKEFESDVPVRCILFVDASQGVRLGPPGATPVMQLTSLASGVAQAAAGNRDLIGLAIFDEACADILPPARTQTHLIGLLRRLAEAAARLPTISQVPTDELTRRGTSLARDIHPDLLSRRVNTMPWGRLWRPLLDTRWGWLVAVAIALTPLLVIQKEWLRETAGLALDAKPHMSSGILRFLIFLALWAFFAFSPALVGLSAWFVHGMRGWFNPRRGNLTRRKRLSSVLALREGTGAAGVERYIHDDAAYAEAIGRFLTQHRQRCPMPLYDDEGRYRFRGHGKTDVLAAAMVRAVGRARDNELYAILADLTDLGPDLLPVLKATRMARARHHQVLVIVPWPSDIPAPADDPTPPTPEDRKPKKIRGRKASAARTRLAESHSLIRAALIRQYHLAYRELRRELSRAGASLVRVDQADAVQVVLDRLDRLRGMRSRR